MMLFLAGCPGAHSDYPGNSCKTSSECYQGETCVLGAQGGTCQSSDGGGP